MINILLKAAKTHFGDFLYFKKKLRLIFNCWLKDILNVYMKSVCAMDKNDKLAQPSHNKPS